MLAVNIFPYGHNKKLPKKGVGMGLQNIMIIAEDDNLGGSSPPPEADFAGVNLAQNFDPAGQFGAGSAGPPVPPAASVLPPARLVTPPPAYALPPAPVRTEDLW
jgi:hypothetical protein